MNETAKNHSNSLWTLANSTHYFIISIVNELGNKLKVLSLSKSKVLNSTVSIKRHKETEIIPLLSMG